MLELNDPEIASWPSFLGLILTLSDFFKFAVVDFLDALVEACLHVVAAILL